MNDYPDISPATQGDIQELLRIITRERPNDIRDFQNLNNRFMAGRKVGKVPSSSSDVTALDRIGDFNIAEDTGVFYLFTLVDDGGTATWGRVALDLTW